MLSFVDYNLTKGESLAVCGRCALRQPARPLGSKGKRQGYQPSLEKKNISKTTAFIDQYSHHSGMKISPECFLARFLCNEIFCVMFSFVYRVSRESWRRDECSSRERE